MSLGYYLWIFFMLFVMVLSAIHYETMRIPQSSYGVFLVGIYCVVLVYPYVMDKLLRWLEL